MAWRDQGLGDICVAVNLSAIQFDRSNLEAVVIRELASSGLAPQSLELEVTEAVALRHLSSTASTLAALRQAGVRIALDDFGTGFASMTYLKQLPCDKLGQCVRNLFECLGLPNEGRRVSLVCGENPDSLMR